MRHANRVSELDFATISQSGCDEMLRDEARIICRAAVDLRRVLTRERSATMASHTAVRIDDDLASGQTGIAHRTADHEPAGRIDEVTRLHIEQSLGDHGPNDVVHDEVAELRM